MSTVLGKSTISDASKKLVTYKLIWRTMEYSTLKMEFL
jgi:hypothetical protein